jgi:hypothetical protein
VLRHFESNTWQSVLRGSVATPAPYATTLASFLLSFFVKGSKRSSVNELPLSGLEIVEKKLSEAPYNKVQSTEKNPALLGLIWMNAPFRWRNNGKICEELADFQKGLSTMETFSYMKGTLRQRES